ncbi:MAG: polyribonucleotide nucleotidyltransferase [Candidatus Omnitrophota bacterium]|nr:MAG: polyribonucleotide nucleotidyltransferase [Candidatus Omnitrophota bacterium]
MKRTIRIGTENFIVETGEIAKQAAGAVTVRCGETVVLSALTWAKEPKEESDFLPLTVDYRERTYAVGKIPGGFFKREGRPTEKEILVSRLIDRTVRTLFPEGFNHEVQIVSMVLSADGKNEPDWLAVNATCIALILSDLPVSRYAGAIRIGKDRRGFIVNPSYAQQEESELNLIVAATEQEILMLEGEGKEVKEESILEAMKIAQGVIKQIIALQKEMFAERRIEKKEFVRKKVEEFSLYLKVKEICEQEIRRIVELADKKERREHFDLLFTKVCEQIKKEISSGELEKEEIEREVKAILEEIRKREARRLIIEKRRRQDGRGFKEIRKLECKVGVLPCTHGSALFTRGQTQSLVVVTLGTKMDEQIVEALEGESRKKFMLHYNFPPFSVGEVKPLRAPGRREIGHGVLAERALKSVLPSEEEFPYTIRIVSDILESNGSSSMATVCGGSLALMDAGVPVKSAVAGVAVGLLKEGEEVVLLTDIAGDEDHYGDMDLKIAGTSKGITAIQMDLKIEGLGLEIIAQAFKQSKEAREQILHKMAETIDKPRPDLSPYAPRISVVEIDPAKIGNVIGPAGKNIKEIIHKTGVVIDIDEQGKVMIASPDKEALKKAIAMIHSLTEQPEVGKLYLAKVRKITDFGAFCEIFPGQDGLIHISELSDRYIRRVGDVIKVGDEVLVKVIRIDDQGRISLSKKQAERRST